MKHQQVVPDYFNMFKTSCTCLLLAFSGYVLLKMIQAVFWLPGYLEKNQKRLEEMAQNYTDHLDVKIDEQQKLIENNKMGNEVCDIHEEKIYIQSPEIDIKIKPEDNIVETKKIK